MLSQFVVLKLNFVKVIVCGYSIIITLNEQNEMHAMQYTWAPRTGLSGFSKNSMHYTEL